jgi:hypothetical protein
VKKLAAAAVALAAIAWAGRIDADAAWSVKTVNPAAGMKTGTLLPPTGVIAMSSGSCTGSCGSGITVQWAPPPVGGQGTQTTLTRTDMSSGGTLTLVATAATTSQYDDAAVTVGTNYCYVLRTVVGQWRSTPTASVCAVA